MLDASVGFALDAPGQPTASCPDGMGHRIRALRMPSACQLTDEPSQSWDASGPVAMGYWTEADLPFYDSQCAFDRAVEITTSSRGCRAPRA
jgi:hypothetical protein